MSDAPAHTLKRFRVEERLGSGGFGVVHRAFDTRHQIPVALKVLHALDGEAIYSFKKEFRALADISHPNLVKHYELFRRGEDWCVSMEFIDGVDLLSWVRRPDLDQRQPSGAVAPTMPSTSPKLAAPRPSPPTSPSAPAAGASGQPAPAGPRVPCPAHVERLRGAFGQLVRAIQALHSASILHRDLKPSNVMVDLEGRVKVLDFGVVRASYDRDDEGRLGGTPAYASPEQLDRLPLTPASDWYSVGVMLFEALTGRLPFEGSFLAIATAKVKEDPPRPSDLAHDVPADLEELTMALLTREPGDRPTGPELLELLSIPSGGQPVTGRDSDPSSSPRVLVDRAEERAALWEAFRRSQQGGTTVVLLHGPSGMGKTALVQWFLDELRERESPLILEGRCYELDSVPYKALDTAIDTLSQHLRRMRSSELREFLPRGTGSLKRLFPALNRVPAIANVPNDGLEFVDLQEVRRRAFGALGALLGSLGERQPLVLWIDDLQWGDVDSAAVLADLLRPDRALPLLFVGSYRDEEAGTSPFLKALLGSPALDARRADVQPVTVDHLDERHARELADLLVKDHQQAAAVASEAAGSPFFIRELAYQVRQSRRDAGEPRALSLGQMLLSRVAVLPEDIRELLHVVALAGRPIDGEIARRAAGVAPGRYLDWTMRLRSRHLVRTRHTGADRALIEPYHERMARSLEEALELEMRRTIHTRIADVLEETGSEDVELLARHHHLAGRAEQARRYATMAADRAFAALAFEQAAEFYRFALELGEEDGEVAQRVRVCLADALANAGRGRDAADAYEAAVERSESDEQALILERKAGEQLLFSGHYDEGIATFERVLARVGVKMSGSTVGTLAGMAMQEIRPRVRRLKHTRRDESEVPQALLRRVDTLWAATLGISMCAPLKSAGLQAKHLSAALKAGEPKRLARAVGIRMVQAAGSTTNLERTQRYNRVATELAEASESPEARAEVLLSSAGAAWMEARFEDAIGDADEATRLIEERCVGMQWHLDSRHILALGALHGLGRWGRLQDELPGLVEDARRRGDLYLEVNLRVRYGPIAALARDDSEAAREELGRLEAQPWPKDATETLRIFELVNKVNVALYEGRGQLAHDTFEDAWKSLKRSMFVRIQYFRITLATARGRAALGAARQTDDDKARARGSRLARTVAKQLTSESSSWGEALGALIGACADAIDDPEAAETSFREAAEALDAIGLGLESAAAWWRLAALPTVEDADELGENARERFVTERVVVPERIVGMLAP